MKKKSLLSGDILAIPLPKGLGYGFAKYIDLLEVDSGYSYPDLIRICTKRSSEPKAENLLFDDNDLLFSPLLVSAIGNTVRNGIWKVVQHQVVTDKDIQIPEYRFYGPLWITDEKKATEWYYVPDGDIAKKVRATRDQVKHLALLGASGTGIVEIELAMAFIKMEGLTVEDYFDLKESVEQRALERMRDFMPYYMQQPEHRGKAVRR